MSEKNTSDSTIHARGPKNATADRAFLTGVRFEYIDGLRGVAALMVAVAHLAAAAEDRHAGILGPGVAEFADLGRYGVQIFFVLSGFVIAHSVFDGDHSFRYFGRYVGRRFVRLDLPYWSVILLEVGLLWLSGKVMAQYSRELPSIDQILANALYLQQFLGYQHILPVFWTLCYEVQFYLVFVFSLVLLAKTSRAGASTRALRAMAGITLFVTFGLSLGIFVGALPSVHPALFVDRWFQFALGVILYLHCRGNFRIQPFICAVALCVFSGVFFGNDSYRVGAPLVTAATAIAILASLAYRRWRAPLVRPSMQFFGQISYSLYLLHLAIGWRTTVLVRELVGDQYSTGWAYVAFCAGLASSIAAAWVLNTMIERPAINLARRISLPKRPPGKVDGVLVPAVAPAT